jgi:hypothetical protein
MTHKSEVDTLRQVLALAIAIVMAGSVASLQAQGGVITIGDGLAFQNDTGFNPGLAGRADYLKNVSGWHGADDSFLEGSSGRRAIGVQSDINEGGLGETLRPTLSEVSLDDFSDYLATVSLTDVNGATFEKEWAFGFDKAAFAVSVPEPSALALVGMGLAGIAVLRRRE